MSRARRVFHFVRTSFSTAAAAFFGLAAISGCQEPPSYRLRWTVDGQTLSRASQCSEVGVFDVQVRTIDVLGRTVDVKTYPCFGEDFEDPRASAPGAAVNPGVYAVELRGVSRNAVQWQDDAELSRQVFDATTEGNNYLAEQRYDLCRPALPQGAPGQEKILDLFACRPEDLVCDCVELIVPEEGTPLLDEFDLERPPECLDGLDNDNDGLVDRQDTACAGGFIDNDENASVAQANFSVAVSFFGKNPSATCASIRQASELATVLVEVGDERISNAACSDDITRFARPLPEGEHVVRVTLLSFEGDAIAPAFEETVTVLPDVGGSFDIEADFTAGDFTDPIMGLAAFALSFQGSEDQTVRGCEPTGGDNGALSLATVRVALVDGHGAPISTVTLDDGTPLDGVSEFPCPGGVVLTEDLTWGDYLVQVEALSAEGEVCFSSVGNGTPAAPFESFTVRPPRVVPAPDSCRDCESNDDCGALVCDEGVCVAPCERETDCDDTQMCVEQLCVDE